MIVIVILMTVIIFVVISMIISSISLMPVFLKIIIPMRLSPVLIMIVMMWRIAVIVMMRPFAIIVSVHNGISAVVSDVTGVIGMLLWIMGTGARQHKTDEQHFFSDRIHCCSP
jgi:hypothetical protein